MRRSHTPEPGRQRLRPTRRASATTADGMAAERIALADRERRLTLARTAARELQARASAR
jgi:hypothetical protein